jgi:hypothetical protein
MKNISSICFGLLTLLLTGAAQASTLADCRVVVSGKVSYVTTSIDGTARVALTVTSYSTGGMDGALSPVAALSPNAVVEVPLSPANAVQKDMLDNARAAYIKGTGISVAAVSNYSEVCSGEVVSGHLSGIPLVRSKQIVGLGTN